MGSGRPKKRTVDRCIVLDVNALASQMRGQSSAGRLTWRDQRTDECLLAVRYRADGRRVMVACDGWRQDQAIGMTTTRLVSGGLRRWLECPRCGGRVGKLYLPSGDWLFACRLCHNLTYLANQQGSARQAGR
jgi:hypothetical protein